jgi:hypothetical protein
MRDAVLISQLASGVFLLVGLVSGVWKYRHMITSEEARAPVYVDICHRSALMYSFACLVLAQLAARSVWPATVNVIAALVPIGFFASAVATYAVHGVLRDTDNMLARPHRMGRGTVPGGAVSAYVYALAIGEIGGVAVLFAGAIEGLT